MNEYCIYLHLNPTTNQPFYVGVSSNLKRPYNVGERNPIWKRYVKKYGNYIVEIPYKNLTKDEAYSLEKELIQKHGRKNIDENGILVNISTGGDGGNKGIIWSEDQNRRRAESNKGSKRSGETKQKMREAKLGIKASEETKQKMRDAKLGKKRPKIREALLGKKQPQSFFEKKNKKINQLSLEGEYIKTFPSIKHAAQEINTHYSNISAVLTKRQITAGGYKWEYVM